MIAAIAVVAALVVTTGVVVGIQFFGGPSAAQIADAEARWGLSPKPDAHADYQPDVVVLSHGAVAIEKLLDDGLTWRLDERYPGVDRIVEGSVLFLTSRVVGRVAALEHPKGGGVDVVLVPVDLPEVLRTADFDIDESISEGDFAVRTDDSYPGMLDDRTVVLSEEPDDGLGSDIATPTSPTDPPAPTPAASTTPSADAGSFSAQLAPVSFREPLAAAAAAPTPSPTDTGWNRGPVTVSFEPWSVEMKATRSSLGFKAAISRNGLKGGIDTTLSYQDLRVSGAASIRDGSWRSSPTMVLTGLTGVKLGFWGGSANGLVDNTKFRFDIPIEVSKQLWVGEIPLTLKAKFKYYFVTAFSAKNATLAASASYSLSGELGVRDGEAVVPTLGVVQSLVDSISGMSLGIDSAIFAIEARFDLGLGLPVASIGPYGKIVYSVGIIRGSALTSPWGVPCQGTVRIEGGGGIGAQLPSAFTSALEKRLHLKKLTVGVTLVERMKDIVNRTRGVPMCPGAMAADTAPTETPPVQPRQTDNDPFTAAGARPVPGPGTTPRPRPEKPTTEAVENPTSPNPDLTGDGAPEGPMPGPKQPSGSTAPPPSEVACDLEPDPRHPGTNSRGRPIAYRCKSEPSRPPAPTPSPTPSDGNI